MTLASKIGLVLKKEINAIDEKVLRPKWVHRHIGDLETEKEVLSTQIVFNTIIKSEP